MRGLVRYMDDLVWWTDDRAAARAAAEAAGEHLTSLGLRMKPPLRVGRSRDGLRFCGFRILPSRIMLSRRRRQRYARLRAVAERAWLSGRIGSVDLQHAYSGALALTLHAEAVAWRRLQLRRVPLEPAMSDV